MTEIVERVSEYRHPSREVPTQAKRSLVKGCCGIEPQFIQRCQRQPGEGHIPSPPASRSNEPKRFVADFLVRLMQRYVHDEFKANVWFLAVAFWMDSFIVGSRNSELGFSVSWHLI